MPIEIDASVVVDNQDVCGEREGEEERQREQDAGDADCNQYFCICLHFVKSH